MITMDIKSMFFDRDAVVRAVDRGTRVALSRAGAFIRRRAQTSMRRRKGPSPAGTPPNAHQGNLRKLLFFAWEPTSKTVVVGPVRFARGEAPPLNEFGGRAARKRKGKTVVANYVPRPFMAPALAAEAKNILTQFIGIVTG